MSVSLQDLSVLVKALLADGQVKELDISYNTISDDGLSCLCNYIKVCACVCVCGGLVTLGSFSFSCFIFASMLYMFFRVCVRVCV